MEDTRKRLVVTKDNINYMGLIDKNQIETVIRELRIANSIDTIETILKSRGFTLLSDLDYPVNHAHYVYEIDDYKVLIVFHHVNKKVIGVNEFLNRNDREELWKDV